MKIKFTLFYVLFSLILSFSFTNLKAQFLLSENFEGVFPPSGWTLINEGQYFQGWTQNTFAFNSVSGTNSMAGNVGPFNADAWAFTPAINLNTNTLYRVSYFYRGNMSGSTTGKFKLTIGSGSTIQNQSLVIHNYPSVTNTTFAEGIDTVTVSSSGNYNFSFNCYSDANQSRVFIDSVVIKIINPTPCSGVPSIGIASAPTDVVPGSNFTLALSGNYLLYSGLTFQWQSSLIGANSFSNISGANTSSYTTSQSVNTDYRCIVTCTNGGASVISNITSVLCSNTGSLFRLKYSGTNTNRDINGMHFLTASKGFVAFSNSIGYTLDTGQTYINRNFTTANTNFNGYSVNLTFGFEATGVYAFSQDSLLAYGNYGAEPAILFSANQGINWKVVFHQPFSLDQDISNSINDIKFWNSNSGIAINGKYILQTANRGQTWSIKVQLPTAIISRFAKLSLPTATRAYAMAGDKIYRTVDNGGFWSEIANSLPSNTGLNFKNISFVNSNVGYITKGDNLAVYKTINGGGSWVQMNDEIIMPVGASDMHFVNETTGYICQPYRYEVFKTTNSGVTWEKCKRNTTLQNGNYGMQRMFFLNSQTAWAGGSVEYLMMTTTGGNPTLPKANFKVDTINFTPTGMVNLTNLSKPYYQHQWFINGILLNTSFSTSYLHNNNFSIDTIKLVVTNSGEADTLVLYQDFPSNSLPPVITSVSPISAGYGETVTITGSNLAGATSLSFGGVAPLSFIVVSPTSITAIIGVGASGNVVVTKATVSGSFPVFTYIPKPFISSFSPTQAASGTFITITGFNFTGTTAVTFGGIAAASFSVSSPTVIYAPIGSGATGNVSVTNSFGTGTASGFTFIPAPTITSFTPAIALAGTLVTVTGTNFTNILSVVVGGISYTGSYIFVSSTQIQIPITSQGASGNIVIVTNGGTASISGFLYNPIPTVVSINPPEAGTGMAVTFTGTNFFGVTSVTFGGVSASSFIVNSTTSITAIVAGGASGFAVVTNAYGSSNSTFGIPNFTFITRPVVDTIFPSSGPVGSLITIQGGNYNTNPLNNYVYFGSVRASIVSATLTTLTVLVPSGSVYEKITVTNNSLTGYSKSPFNVTFTGGGVPFTANSFASKIDFNAGQNPSKIKIADLDNDGKSDILIANADTFIVYRNTSSNAGISFTAVYTFVTAKPITSICAADIDGDGKLDVIIATTLSNVVSGINPGYILKNISSSGNFAFLQAVNFNSPGFATQIAVADMNKDGKPDIAISDASTAAYSLLINTTAGSIISFNAGVIAFPENLSDQPMYSTSILIDDINRDGIPYIIVGSDNNHFYVNGIRKESFFSGSLNYMVSADFDSDGKSDLLTQNYFLKNIGNFNFLPTYFNGNPVKGQRSLSDIDGDGKVDFASVSQNSSFSSALVYVSRNISSVGLIAFEPDVTYVDANSPSDIAVGDLDNDGKPDIAFANPQNHRFSILKNQVGSVQVCANSGTSFTSNITGTSYQWQSDAGGGFINISNNINYSGANNPTLILSNVPFSWNGYKYRCVINNTLFSNVFLLVVSTGNPSVSIFTASNTICSSGSTPVTFIATANNAGATPNYQWQVNGSNVGINSNIFSSSAFINNDQIKVIVTSNSNCSVGTVVTSNIITMTVVGIVPASVTIATNTTSACSNNPTTFTATPTNGGTTPIYQWKVNGINAGTNNPTFTISSLQNNDQVTVVMTSSLTCASPASATSNAITMTVTPAPVANAGNDVSICSGSSTQFTGSGGTTYLWSPATGLNNPTIANPIATPASTSFYILTASNGSCTSRDTVLVTVNSTTLPTVIISSTNTNICSGTSVTFTANSTNGGTTPIYQWKINGANAGTNSPTFTTGTLQNNAQVTVVMTSNLACASPTSATSNAITMTVTPAPIANAGNDVTICTGSSTRLSGSGGTTYAWSPSAGLSNPNIANPIASPATTTTYILNTFSGTCTSTDTVLVTVSLPTTPSVNINTASNNVCSGSNITFNAVALNAGANPTYQWQVNGINAGTNNATFASNTLQNNAQVKVTVTNNGCTTTPVVTSNVITMNVTVLASPLVTLSTNVLTVTNGDAAAVYTWQVFTSTIWSNVTPTATGLIYTVTQPGEYRVKAEKSACVLYSASQVSARTNSLDSTLYYIYLNPNPARGSVTVYKIVPSQNWQSLDVINLQAQRMLPAKDIRGLRTVPINISSLAPGLYFIRLTNKDGRKLSYKFIKE